MTHILSPEKAKPDVTFFLQRMKVRSVQERSLKQLIEACLAYLLLEDAKRVKLVPAALPVRAGGTAGLPRCRALLRTPLVLVPVFRLPLKLSRIFVEIEGDQR